MTDPGGLVLAAKVAAAAIFVVTASRATERADPFLGAMIGTLPVSAGPVYVFLAMDHGAAFISESARTSVDALRPPAFQARPQASGLTTWAGRRPSEKSTTLCRPSEAMA